MMGKGKRILLFSLAAVMAFTLSTIAYDLPALNLGFTSFVDGGPPAGPGWYYTQYIQYYTGKLKNSDGDDLQLPADFTSAGIPTSLDTARINGWIALFQVIYQSDQEVIPGGKWGMDVILPYMYMNVDTDSPVLDDGNGIGDLLVGPYIQWDPIMGKNGPVLLNRVELQVMLPTGKYNENDAGLDASANFFSLDPYWSCTWFMAPKWTASWRIHYLWNGKNNDPSSMGAIDDSQAGQAIHGNLAIAYEAIEKQLRIGLNGYALKQITKSEIDGNKVDDSEEQVLAIGPGIVWHISQDQHVFLNAYFETEAENRPEGQRINLRYVQHF